MDQSGEHRPLHGEEPKLSVAVTVGSNSLLSNFANNPYANAIVLSGGIAISLSAILVIKYLKPLFKKTTYSSSQFDYSNDNQYGYYDSSDYYYSPSSNSYQDVSSSSYSPNSDSYNYYYR